MRSGHLRATVAMLVVVGACTSSDPEPADEGAPDTAAAGSAPAGPTTEATILQSADGQLTIEVPAGAVTTDVDLGIDIVEPDSVPWLEGTRQLGPVYRLRPEGLTFPELLPLLHQIPVDEIGVSSAEGTTLPLASTLIGDDELVAVAEEQRGRVAEVATYVHLSRIDRFGVVALIDGGVALTLEPAMAAHAEDELFEMVMTAAVDRDGTGPWPAYDLEQRWSVGAALSGGSEAVEPVAGFGASDSTAPWVVARSLSCEVAGTGQVTVEVSAQVSDAPEPRATTVIALDSEISCGNVGR